MSTPDPTLEIAIPDDWHLHLRDGAALPFTVPATTRSFARAIVMPNLVPPVDTVAAARAYRGRILEHVPPTEPFEPLMTLYLTSRVTPAEVRAARASGFIHACKLYPAGATTHSEAGIEDLHDLYPTLEAMEECDLPLLVHGEVTDPDVDIFDRERVFLERHLAEIVRRFPRLRVVLEHLTTAEGVDFVREAPSTVAATLTPQHLLFDRNDLLVGGLRPHLYCLPILKARRHREALRAAATSGNPRFFLGTDSAPHAHHAKESACGCAGCFSAPVAIALYAGLFEQLGALDRLEAFAAHHGADFYRLPRNTGRLRLTRSEDRVPEHLPYVDGSRLVPLAAGAAVGWQSERL